MNGYAMQLAAPHAALARIQREWSAPPPGQALVRVLACGVCRTDLHLVDGELPQARYPVVPGHEVVGVVEAIGPGVQGLSPGARVGIPWLGATCGDCAFCRAGRENLCDDARFTGCHLDGGYATHLLAQAAYCIALGDRCPDAVACAPLLCAGLIGWRALAAAGVGERLGLYGFGAAAHIIVQIATARGQSVYAFTRPGDVAGQDFALRLGARWAGDSDASPPQRLDAAIVFAPVGELVPVALRAVRKGGRVVCAGIHMSDIPRMPYALLWGERELVSVANLTRDDAHAFFDAASRTRLDVHATPYPLAAADEALQALRSGALLGAAVLVP